MRTPSRGLASGPPGRFATGKVFLRSGSSPQPDSATTTARIFSLRRHLTTAQKRAVETQVPRFSHRMGTIDSSGQQSHARVWSPREEVRRPRSTKSQRSDRSRKASPMKACCSGPRTVAGGAKPPWTSDSWLGLTSWARASRAVAAWGPCPASHERERGAGERRPGVPTCAGRRPR